MEGNILRQGKGVIAKIAVASVAGTNRFAESSAKDAYVKALDNQAGERVCLIAYCIIDRTAHFIIKAEDVETARNYVSGVNSNFVAQTGGDRYAIPFSGDYDFIKIKSGELISYINGVHALAPNGNPASYPFCSYQYIMEGTHGATQVILVEIGDMSEDEYLANLQGATAKRFNENSAGKENLKSVLKDCKSRFLGERGGLEEGALIATVCEVCTRTGLGYEKAAKKLGINPKSRPDFLVSVCADMVIRKNKSFSDTFNILKLKKMPFSRLQTETVAEINRIHNFSYDHIENSMGIYDKNYDVLVEILCGMHRKFKLTFEELCIRFHLKNEIISIRKRCGF